ncbi:MAG: DUF4837 family protein [Bacteroidales bacterium]|nr:DUF4837 family protein [Bacteroidales bacterium]
MKSKLIFTVLAGIFFTTFGLTSCNNQNSSSGSYKPSSMGSTAELLVVLQNEQQWDNPIGTTIKKYFAADQFGMPQAEPIFKLMHLKQDLFNDSFQKERNIFIVNIDPKVKQASIQVRRNVWASPQLVFTLTAPDIESFVKELSNRYEYFIDKYMESERNRILDVYRTTLNNKVIQSISTQFDFTMDVPAGYYVAVTKPGFMWLRHEASMYSQGILIISLPYTDTTQFARDNVLDRIQKFERMYVPGPTKGSYMTLDREFVIPRMTLVHDFPASYTEEIRGLWKVENDFMGGPFVSYTFLNPKNNQIVTLFGYVYEPNKNKRDLLLQVESVLYSTDFGKKLKQ